MVKFHQTSTTEFELVSNEISYLFEQYNQIEQFIKENFPAEYHGLLAKPERKGSELEWYTNLPGDLQRLESFPPGLRERLLGIYNARRHEIDNRCMALSHADDFDRQIWANILRSTFNPDNLQLFSNGTDIQLVWGIRTMRKFDYEIPFNNYRSFIVPASIPGRKEGSDEPTGDVNPPAETFIGSNQEDVSYIDTPAITPAGNSPDRTEQSDPQTTLTNKPEEEAGRTAIRDKEQDLKKPRHWFYGVLDRFEEFAKRFWWLLVLVALITAFLLYLILIRDQGEFPMSGLQEQITEEELDIRFREIMPVNPGIRMPIDTTRFREDDESGAIVISGLVNVAIVGNPEKFKRMAVDLKSAFPGEEYQITYYDTNTSRLQLSLPFEKDSLIKTELKSKLSSYELLVWDESVFRTSLVSNDPFFLQPDKSWHLRTIRLPTAWEYTTGDTSVVIAVIDDGFDLNHREFEGKRIVNPYNIRSHNDRVYGNAIISHGTHVAALALGNAGNAYGGSGVAPGCSFMPVQIGGDGPYFSMTDVVDGILYALNHGADVINLSLGKYFGEALIGNSPSELQRIIDTQGKDEEAFWKELFRLASEKNTSIIIAAGNEDLPIGLDPMQRSDATIKVIAVDQGLYKAEFSNYCESCLDKQMYISAPGKAVFSAVPGNLFKPFDGTSMAAPLVAGAVGLLKSIQPELENREIIRILHETASPSADRSCPPILQADRAVLRAKR